MNLHVNSFVLFLFFFGKKGTSPIFGNFTEVQKYLICDVFVGSRHFLKLIKNVTFYLFAKDVYISDVRPEFTFSTMQWMRICHITSKLRKYQFSSKKG